MATLTKTKTKTKTKKNTTFTAGKRKNATAQVMLTKANIKTGSITLKYPYAFAPKNIPLESFFGSVTLANRIKLPLEITKTLNQFDIMIKLSGGGISAQASAAALGIARSLAKKSEKYKLLLHQAGLLTRDSRVKERKKYGLKKARKAPQFSKR